MPARCTSSSSWTAVKAASRVASSAASVDQRTQDVVGLAGTVEVGLEVDQVGVREGLLLAGDLAGGDLVEQLLRAVAHRRDRHLGGRHLLLQLADVGRELVGDRGHAVEVAVGPQRLLDPVPAGPLLALLEVGLAQVDPRVQVAEALGDRLDRLPRDARRCVELLRLLDVTGLDRRHELVDQRDQRVGLLLHVRPVGRDSLVGLRVDSTGSPCLVTVTFWRMPSPVWPGLQATS